MQEKEIWKDVPDYEGFYQISTKGRVRSLDRTISAKNGVKYRRKGVVLKQPLSGSGYLFISLCKNSKYKTYDTHKLMAITFLNHKPNGHEKVVNHIDNNKTNNNIENLEIVTNRYNSTCHKVKNKTSKYIGVDWYKAGNCWRAFIRHKSKQIYLGRFKKEEEAAEYYKNAVFSIENNLEIKVKRLR